MDSSSFDSSNSGVDDVEKQEKLGFESTESLTPHDAMPKKGWNSWSTKKKALVVTSSVLGAGALAGIIAGIVIATQQQPSDDYPEIPKTKLVVSTSENLNASYCTLAPLPATDAWFEQKPIQVPDCTQQAYVKASLNGVTPSNVNNQQALENILANCKDKTQFPNGCRVVLDQPGTYKIGGTSLTYDRSLGFYNLTDFTLDGQGNRLLFSRFERFGSLSTVGNLKRALFTNIVWDWDHERWPLASLVKVKQSSKTQLTLEMVDYAANTRQAKPSFDISRIKAWKSLHQVDPERLSMAVRDGREWFNFDSATTAPTVSGNQVSFTITKELKPLPVVDRLYIMKHFIYDAHCVAGYMCESCVWDNITYYGCPGKLMTIQDNSDGLLVRDVKLVLDPARPIQRITATADGLFFNSVKDGGIRIQDSEIAYHGDDCVNIHTKLISGLSFTADSLNIKKTRPTSWDMSKWVPGTPQYDFAEGDFVVMKSWQHVPIHEFTVRDLSQTRDTWTMRLDPPIPESVFAEYADAATQGMTFVANLNRSSDNVVIQNLYCHDTRARGIQIQSSNYLVQDSLFEYIQQPGLVVRTDAETREGAGVSNALVTRCTFSNVDRNDWKQQGALRVYVVDMQNGNSSTYPVHRNVSFVDNVVKDFPRRSFNLQNARNVNVLRNTINFETPDLPETLERGTVYLEDVVGARIAGNTFAPVLVQAVQSGANVTGLISA